MPIDPDAEAEKAAEEEAAREAAEDAQNQFRRPFGRLPPASEGGPDPVQSNADAERRQQNLTAAALAALFFAPFWWNSDRRRFVDSGGRVVSGAAIDTIIIDSQRIEASHGRQLANALQLPDREIRERLVEIAQDRAGMRNMILQMSGRTRLPVELPRGLPGAYLRDTTPLEFFEQYMSRRIRSIHLNNAAIAAGGFDNLSDEDIRRLVRGTNRAVPPRGQGTYRGLDFHMRRLDRMMEEIRNGDLPLDGRFVQRAQMYTDSGRQTFDTFNRGERLREGFTECRNVLRPAEHCNECPALSSRGYIPVKEMPVIGARECLTNCACYLVYRNPDTGITRR